MNKSCILVCIVKSRVQADSSQAMFGFSSGGYSLLKPPKIFFPVPRLSDKSESASHHALHRLHKMKEGQATLLSRPPHGKYNCDVLLMSCMIILIFHLSACPSIRSCVCVYVYEWEAT